MYLIGFQLLLIPFVLYNMVAFLLDIDLATPLLSVPLLSGRSMPISTGDLLVLLGIALLYVEILKSTRLASKAVMDHLLSLILFVVMVFQFVAMPRAATSTYLMLMALSCVDVIGGFTITIRTARRDITTDRAEHMTPSA